MASKQTDQQPFDEVWTTGADFKKANPGCVLSIKTASTPFSTGRAKFVVGLHNKTTKAPAFAQHTAMKLGDAGCERLIIRREAMLARKPDAPTDFTAFTNLD
jgi:hypothetical protein